MEQTIEARLTVKHMLKLSVIRNEVKCWDYSDTCD